MSRVGKRPVTVPSGVTATVEGQTVKMKGPKGQLQFLVHDDVVVLLEAARSRLAAGRDQAARALYGTSRAQVANLVEGVTKGSREARDQRRRLSRRGAGQEPAVAIGFSHDVVYPIPEGIGSRCRNRTRSYHRQ